MIVGVFHSFTKTCPSCGCEQRYSLKSNRDKAERENKKCTLCTATIRANKYSGTGNPFYGKTHTSTFKEQLSLDRKGRRMSPITEFTKGCRSANSNIKPIFECWVKKYGLTEATLRHQQFKVKQREAHSGEKNRMYGKPSPIGSGNGWSGWYKGWYFRSLKELSFMVKVIERFGFKWETVENKLLAIPYIADGVRRNYYADFLLNGKYLVEIKPKKLWKSRSVLLKKVAATKHAELKGWKYKIIDIDLLSRNQIKIMWENGIISFTRRYEEKMKTLLLLK